MHGLGSYPASLVSVGAGSCQHSTCPDVSSQAKLDGSLGVTLWDYGPLT